MTDRTKQYPSPFQIYAPVPVTTDGRYADYMCPDCGSYLEAMEDSIVRARHGHEPRLRLRLQAIESPSKEGSCYCGARISVVIPLGATTAPYMEVRRMPGVPFPKAEDERGMV